MPTFSTRAALVTGVGQCAVDGLTGSLGGVPPGFRTCLLLPTTTIPWDNCGCPGGGQFAQAIQSVYGSQSFPTPFVGKTQTKCGPDYEVVQVLTSITRCVPSIDTDGQPPTCDAELAAAYILESDRETLRQAISCCLQQLFTDRRIAAWSIGASVTVGELGGCAGIETPYLIGVRSCLCGTG